MQRGERVRTLVKVKNIGQGAALRTEAILRNGSGQEGILISAGRFDTKDLAPGASRTFTFVYEVGSDFRGDEYQLDLVVADTVLGESVTDKIKVKLAPAGAAPSTEEQPVTITRSEAVLRQAPTEDALVVGYAPKGTAWKSTGRIGAFFRVEIESGRPAFVAAAEVTPGGSVHGSFVPKWQVTPPVLAVVAPTAVPGDTVHIKATASDDTEVKDVYIRVWNRDSKLPPKKVFYLPNKGDKKHLAFETDVPLWPGSNLVQVFARETNEIQSVQTVVVLDRGAATVVQKTGSAAESNREVKPRSRDDQARGAFGRGGSDSAIPRVQEPELPVQRLDQRHACAGLLGGAQRVAVDGLYLHGSVRVEVDLHAGSVGLHGHGPG